MRAPTAPVNAPRSWPNISDSSSSGGIAPQLTAMNGWFARRLCAWMKRAISSLPVPLSPMISTVESVVATRWRDVEDLLHHRVVALDREVFHARLPLRPRLDPSAAKK